MDGGIRHFKEFGLCVCDFVQEEVIKPDAGVPEGVLYEVVTLGHGGCCLSSKKTQQRSDRWFNVQNVQT